MRNRLLLILLMIFFFFPAISFPQDVSDYLILQDIGPYKISKPEKLIPGFQPIGGLRTYDGSGIIAATGHFADHPDKTYEVMYLGETDELPSPTVQVTNTPEVTQTSGCCMRWREISGIIMGYQAGHSVIG